MKKMVLQIMRSAAAAVMLLFAAIVPAAAAEEPPFKVSLSTDRNNVVSGGNVNVTLTFSHTDLNDGIRLPEVKGGSWRTDRVSQSSSTRIINGRREDSVSYSLPLTVSAPAGSAVEIPAATFKRRNGQSAATAPVTIKVLEAGAVPPEERISAAILLPEGGRKYYTGEDIPLEFRLSIPYRMRLRSAEYPRISGLEQGIIADYSKVNPRNPRFAPPREKRQGGNVIISFDTAVKFLVPGTFRPEAAMEIAVETPSGRNNRRDPFGDSFFEESFFGGAFSRNSVESRQITFTPPERPIEIIPLPTPPAGAKTIGLVGDWQIEAALSAASVRNGEPVELAVTLTGKGSSEGLTAPKLTLPGFRVYPPEIKKQPGQVKITYALIPLETGEKQLDISFAVFNTAAGKYLLSKKPLPLAVSGNSKAVSAPSAAAPAPALIPLTPEKADNGLSPADGDAVPPRQELFYQKAEYGRDLVRLPLWKNSLTAAAAILGCGILISLLIEYLEHRREEQNNDPEFAAHRLRRKQLPELLAVLRQGRADENFIRLKVLPFITESLRLPPGTDAAAVADKLNDREAAEALRTLSSGAFVPGREAASGETLISRETAGKFIRLLRNLALALLIVPAVFTTAALNGAGTDAGNTAFNAGNYPLAVEKYRQAAWQGDSVSPAALYNLGNSYYMMGDYPLARMALETAHRLLPGDSECAANLDLVNRKLMLPEADPASTPAELLANCRNRLRPDEYLTATAILLSVAMILLALRRRMPRPAYYGAGISTAAALLTAAAMIYQLHTLYAPERAIVTSGKIELRSRPTLASGRVEAVISGGSDARILEDRGEWLRIDLNGRDGWVQKKDVSRLFTVPEKK